MSENANEYAPLTFDEILEDREYQAEFDRRVQKAINTAKSKWELQHNDDNSIALNEELSSLRNEIGNLKQTLSNRDARDRDMEITYGIEEALKDKQFVNDYTKNAVVNEIKVGLYTRDGVTIDSLFDEITKDKEGILVNPNKSELPQVNADIFAGVDKEAFEKMGYKERVALKQENPELFEQLNTK